MFLIITIGGGWLLEIPVWMTGGIAPGGHTNPLFLPLTLVMMFTPAIAAVIVTLTILRPVHPGRFLGLVPLRPWRRTIGYSLLGFVGPWLLGTAAIGVAVAFGVVHLQTSSSTIAVLLTIPIASFLTAFAAFGEELGWRGFLLPALRPLGTWPALILHGIVWGVWHSPIILLGYNYGITSPIGVVLMTVTTLLIGMLFGWLRMRSASVYPSSFAHGSLNASSGILLAALLPASQQDVVASLLGWTGWLVVVVIVVILIVAGTYRWAPQAAARSRATAPIEAEVLHL
jgi:uncharacterized protein